MINPRKSQLNTKILWKYRRKHHFFTIADDCVGFFVWMIPIICDNFSIEFCLAPTMLRSKAEKTRCMKAVNQVCLRDGVVVNCHCACECQVTGCHTASAIHERTIHGNGPIWRIFYPFFWLNNSFLWLLLFLCNWNFNDYQRFHVKFIGFMRFLNGTSMNF